MKNSERLPARGFHARCAACDETIPEDEAIKQNKERPAGYYLNCQEHQQQVEKLNVETVQQFRKLHGLV
jgi:hypothetical protein